MGDDWENHSKPASALLRRFKRLPLPRARSSCELPILLYLGQGGRHIFKWRFPLKITFINVSIPFKRITSLFSELLLDLQFLKISIQKNPYAKEAYVGVVSSASPRY